MAARIIIILLLGSLAILASGGLIEENGEDKAMFKWEEEGGQIMDRGPREARDRQRRRHRKKSKGKKSQGGMQVLKKRKQVKSERNKKRRLQRKKLTRKSKKSKTKTISKKRNLEGRNEQRFSHCEYIDLSEIGKRGDSNCHEGSKFLFKPAAGHRRQFIITNVSNIAVFLKHKHKVSNCTSTGLIDVTSQAKCKDLIGATEIKLQSIMGSCRSSCVKQNTTYNTTATSTNTTTATTTTTTTVSTTAAPTLGSDTTVSCPCPEIRTFVCSTKVESTGNTHKVTCNKQAEVTVSCGSKLIGAKNVFGIMLDYYNHDLCKTKDYTSILVGYTWRCGDRDVPVPSSGFCDGDTTVAASTTTVAAANTTVAIANTTVAASNTTVVVANTTVVVANTTVAVANTTVAVANTTVAVANTTVAAANTTAAKRFN